MLEVVKRVVDFSMMPLNIVENYIAREEKMKMDQWAYLSGVLAIVDVGLTDTLVSLLLLPP